MLPLERQLMTEDEPHQFRENDSQMGLTLRAEGASVSGHEEALSEGIRRAEAILFAAGEPLSAVQISEILPHGVEAPEVLMALRSKYTNSGVNLVEVAGKWRFQTAADLDYLFVEERQVQKKLGQAAMETLAIIAYGQPVTRAEIEAVRGVAVSKSTLDTLMETGWVKFRGRRKTPGQPMTYGTTPDFLEHFGLESLDTLPGKADLEAEGLLSDVIPDGFQMPDEEALSEEEVLIEDTSDSEHDDAFVTDFMPEDDDVVEVEATGAESDEGDVPDAAYSPFGSQEIASGADQNSDFEDLEDADETVSVFSYTREASTNSEVDAEDIDEDDHDDDSIKAAVIKLSRENREPDRPMSDWNDDD